MGDNFVVVIAALEGRGFPKRPRHKIVAEARFDGELLAMDPRDHSDSPSFDQELAWELSKKSLQQHRLQRSSIKIQFFAIDSHSGLKEPIGYVILDLRSAVQNSKNPKWYPLLHCKYSKTKPEVQLALFLDDNKSEPNSTVKIVQELKKAAGPVNLNIKSLVPVLNDLEGYYQLGPLHSCTDFFVLSVTVAYANNLPQLVPSSRPLSGISGGFFFYFSLLGNDVTSEPFTDLVNPNFQTERVSVKVRSSVDALRLFFTHQPGLEIHLCCGNESLGSCDVPLSSLLRKDSTEIYMKPVSVEGDFQLTPPNKVKQQMAVLPNSLAPSLGVSVVLKKEDLGAATPVKDHPNAALHVNGGSSPIFKSSPTHQTPPQRDPPKEKEGGKKEEQVRPKHPDAGDADDYSQSFEEDTESPHSASQGEKPTNISEQPNTGKSQPEAVPTASSGAESISVSEIHQAIPAQAHHFTFSIDLRSIRDLASPNTIFVYLKYAYPFLGTPAPIMTQPPVEIRRGSEVMLPQSHCTFNFACTLQQLQDTFRRMPLTVEVMQRDRQMSKDVLIGVAQLPLTEVICAEKLRTMRSDNTPGWLQTFGDRVPVFSVESGGKQKCAEVSMVMKLEDWGPISPTIIPTHPHSHSQVSAASQVQQYHPHHQQQQQHQPQQPAQETNPRQSSEYQMALEFEIWREAREKAFEKELKEKEAQFLAALAEGFKKRDKEREVITQKMVTEYSQMNDKLRTTLAGLEKRDKQLQANEHEVMRLRGELQREHDRKLQEMKEASRRMKDDCDHQVELQRMKVKEMEEIINRYKGELQEADRKHKALEKEFSAFREQLSSKSELQLQRDINLLTLEKSELERKLESANSAKNTYKQKFAMAIKEVARLKQREQEVAKAALRQQQQELEHMRLRYLAAEEKSVTKGDNQQLEEIKIELNKLKQMEEDKLRNMTDSNNFAHSAHHGHTGDKPLNSLMDSSLNEHISRLVEERDLLMGTGAYTLQDKVIIDLDRQIQDAIARRNR